MSRTPRRPDALFSEGDIVVVTSGPRAGEQLRVWYRFGHRLRLEDGSLQYIYDVRPLANVRFSDNAIDGAMSVPETTLRRA